MGETRVTSSARETEQLGETFAKKLRSGDVVALFGELGSGKTTFVKGIARGLGVSRRISSPTFIIVRTYKLKAPHFAKASLGEQNSKRKATAQSAKRFYHIDLYRIESERELAGLGIEEILEDPANIVAIEWAEKARFALSKKRYELYFDHVGENRRSIRIVNPEV